jgi:hypothetical protein
VGHVHVIKQGECLSSISLQYGLNWKTIWRDPNNAQLKQRRKNPNVLLPGDAVFIPDKSPRVEKGATEKRHQFKRLGVPAKARLKFMSWDQPRANERYVLTIDGHIFSGTTDEDGQIRLTIPPDAQTGLLAFENDGQQIRIHFGHIDPVEEITGVQHRLRNLGFKCNDRDGELGPETRSAIREFQKKYRIAESGEADEATRRRLIETHGC